MLVLCGVLWLFALLSSNEMVIMTCITSEAQRFGIEHHGHGCIEMGVTCLLSKNVSCQRVNTETALFLKPWVRHRLSVLTSANLPRHVLREHSIFQQPLLFDLIDKQH